MFVHLENGNRNVYFTVICISVQTMKNSPIQISDHGLGSNA